MRKKINIVFVLKAILFILPIIIICLAFLNPTRNGRWFFSSFLIFCIVERSWEAFYTTKKQGRIINEIDPTLPITIFMYILLTIFCINEFYLITRPLNLIIFCSATVTYILAFILRLWAVNSLGDQWSINIMDTSSASFQKKLIVKGPYEYIRHPIYLGTILEQISIPLLASLYYSAFTILIITVPFHIIKAMIEEKNLVSELGYSYEEYIKNKPRFNPIETLLKRG